MSSGIGHATSTVALAAVAATTPLWASVDPTITIGIIPGILLGIWLSPDLDHHATTVSEKWLPKWLRWPWKLYWSPYEAALKHRSWVSHTPVISTIGRVLYAIPLWYPLWSALETWPYRDGFSNQLLVGLMFADALHWFLDNL